MDADNEPRESSGEDREEPRETREPHDATSRESGESARPEVHAGFLAPFLEEARLGPEESHALLRELGIDPAFVGDRNAWLSLRQLESCLRALDRRTGDPLLIRRAARLSFTDRYMGALRTVIRAFASPGGAYVQMAKGLQRFNKVGVMEVRAQRRGFVELTYRPAENAPPEEEPLVCRGRLENIISVPTIFDLPPAEVDHVTCLHEGADECVYRVRYVEPRPRTASRAALLVGSAAGGGLAVACGGGLPLVVGAMTFGAAALWGLARQRELGVALADSARLVSEQQDALVRSTIANEERFAELLEAKTAVDHQVEERTAELSETSARLRETLDEVQALDRAKTDFFANVSHDLRTPLTLILSPLEALRRGEAPPGGPSAAYESMHLASRRLLALIDRLLDLAKADAGKERLELRSTNVHELLRTIHESFGPAATSRGVDVDVQVEVDVPIELDHRWIDSALSNLTANAMRFARSRIVLRARDLGGEVTLEVEDDGPGIPKNERAVVFERFGQASSETRQRSGTGLGLAIVREAARLHGGHASVEEGALGGARFVLRLPRRVSNAPTETLALEGSSLANLTVPADLPGPDAHAPLALVAEDNPELRRFVAEVLATRFRVRAVVDGEEALAAVRAEVPDLVVTDVAMPRIDGLELTRRLRASASTRDIPILVVTARGEPTEVLEGFDAGADDYLLKPFHGRELLARIDVQLRLRQLARELAHKERLATLGTLAASVAHHVRNPLTALVSGLPAMRRRLADTVDPRSREMLDVFVDCAHRIERITLDLLDLSRVDRQEVAEFHPGEGLAAAIRLLSARVPSGVAFDVSIDESPTLEGRPGDLNHAFLNLIDNAARAVGARGSIRICGAEKEGVYVVTIEDSGPGVPDALSERIFDRFVTTRQRGEGSGIGLAITRDVARAHGGDVRVDRSANLGGARFVLTLPLVASTPS